MRILIINGPNLNLLGRREPEIYGTTSFEEYLEKLRAEFTTGTGVEIDYFQSNIEGEIVDALQGGASDAGRNNCDRADSNERNRRDCTNSNNHAKHNHTSNRKKYDAIILNAGGYTHTSVAIADAVAAIETPVVEAHISQILGREEFRRISLIAPVCRGSVIGFGLDSYRLAILSVIGKSQT